VMDLPFFLEGGGEVGRWVGRSAGGRIETWRRGDKETWRMENGEYTVVGSLGFSGTAPTHLASMLVTYLHNYRARSIDLPPPPLPTPQNGARFT
jgi:hypothetical protein